MSDFLARIGVERPIVQAGMGGGLAASALAAAVSEAGGLGTIGILPAAGLRAEIAAVREKTGKPVAVNLIVPFARQSQFEAAGEADVIVTHWEASPKRRTPRPWIHTVGSADEARAAVAAGADAVIAQGVEAGGHTRGTAAALDTLAQVRAAVGDDYPVLVAGGIAEAADVRAALDSGAVAAVAGTRFLATDESRAHPGYKQRLVAESDTVLTELFGMGWPHAPHRVLPNGATRKWLTGDARGPAGVRMLHAALAPVARYTPVGVQLRMAQRAAMGPLDLSPPAPLDDMSAATLETHPLYAGQTVSRITEIRPAAEVVAALTP